MNAILSRFVAACTLAAIASAPTLSAATEASYPTRPVQLVVSFPPGGSSDFFTRSIANELSKAWGQPVVVDNRPGAGGNIGAQFAARARPDGYTLYMSSLNTHAINPTLYKNPGFDHIKDFTPISKIATVPNVLVVNPALPVKSVAELVKFVKAQPSGGFYASSGAGTGPHISMELFKSMTGTQMAHVPYKGSAPAMADVMAGTVPMEMDNLPAVLAQIKAGKLRALAISSRTRSPELPDVPTMVEAGVPGYEVTSWWAMFAPAGTPAEIVSKVNADVVKALNAAHIKEQFAKQGATPAPSTPAELAELVRTETVRWGKVIKDAGITVD